jgi:pyruvate dehydrogenase (quinone)
MQMLGNAELLTAAKYWRRWVDPRLIVLVLNNGELNFVTWEQRVSIGDAKFTASQELPDFPYRGDPDAGDVIRASLRELVDNFVPH